MALNRVIRVLKADGTEYVLPEMPSWEKMKEIVGGWLEHVTVLSHLNDDDSGFYSSMYINEEGLIMDLPRNAAATELYQRNVRVQFPNSPTPFKDAAEAYRATLPPGTQVITSSPGEEYDNDPYICGDVIFFQGYTREEADELTAAQHAQNTEE